MKEWRKEAKEWGKEKPVLLQIWKEEREGLQARIAMLEWSMSAQETTI